MSAPRAAVGDQEPRFDEPLTIGRATLAGIRPIASPAASVKPVAGIDARQPRNEGGAQQRKLVGLCATGIAGASPGFASARFNAISIEPVTPPMASYWARVMRAADAELLIQVRQGEGEQRQRVGAGRVRYQPVDERGIQSLAVARAAPARRAA